MYCTTVNLRYNLKFYQPWKWKKSEHSVMNLKTQISWLFASVYSSLTVRIEVFSYELHICLANKETRVRYWTLTVKLFHRYRIETSNCYNTVGSTKVFGNPPPPTYTTTVVWFKSSPPLSCTLHSILYLQTLWTLIELNVTCSLLCHHSIPPCYYRALKYISYRL